jgi:hypothetical protein
MFLLALLNRKLRLILMRSLIILILGLSSVYATEGHDYSNIIGPNGCMSCHAQATKVWKASPHQKNFRKFHKNKKAKKIAKRLGIKRIKKSDLCMTCHYTHTDRRKVVAGISCESCHSPAKNWLNVHNTGEKGRIAKMEKAGMTHPRDIYGLAKNCMSCHFMQKEELIEIGQHMQLDAFEFVSWSQGMIRHNYNRSDDGSNAPSSKKKKRLMYITGRVVDLEQGLRGVAEVEKKTNYAVNVAKRTKKALGHLELILKEVEIKEIKTILDLGRKAALKPGNRASLIRTANQVSVKIKGFLKKKNHGDLSAIDKLIPKFNKGEASK